MTSAWPLGRISNAHLVAGGSILFALANALLAPGLSAGAGLIVLAGSAASIVMIVRLSRPAPASLLAEPVRWPTMAACGAVAVALLVLGGAGHVFYPNEDWLTRDAVLGDLVRHPLPITYSHQGREFLLRAPLGMYMVPAAIGRVSGIGAAHLALLIQNATLLALTLYLFTIASRVSTAAFLALFVAFSGLDVIEALLTGYLRTGTIWLPRHLETANVNFQFSSHVTQIFWVPNHALSGWWFTALAILCARGELRVPLLAIMIAALTFWSPLAMVGALAVLLVLLVREAGQLVVSREWWLACAAGAGLLPVLLYLVSDAGSVPQTFLLWKDGFLAVVTIFLVFEIPHFLVLQRVWPRVEPQLKTMLIVAAAFLVVLPVYQLGRGSDLLTRGSIVPLSLLAFVFCSQAPGLLRDPGRGLAIATATIIALGALTPAFEIGRALTTRSFAISSCNVLTAWSQYDPEHWISNYMAASERLPGWLVRADRGQAPLRVDPTKCWPDHPVNPLPMDWQDPKNGFQWR